MSCSQMSVVDNRIDTVCQMGIDIKSTHDYEIRGNRIINPGTGNGASSEWGIGLEGSTTANGVIEGNRITDTLGNMRYGIGAFGSTSAAPDMSTHTFRNNFAAGASDYGYRGAVSATVREWSNNDLSGRLGRALNAPVAGSGRVAPQAFGRKPPGAGAHVIGEIVWNSAPVAAGTIGWVCTSSGTPGRWKSFGRISV